MSEIERKMLYFSETHWTLPDMMEINEAFSRDYDDAAYEKNISRLIRRLRGTADRALMSRWKEAVRTLQAEDHYLLVMIEAA